MSLSQIVAADKELFVRAANNLEGKLQKPVGAAKPLDAELKRLSVSHDITQFLSPLVVPLPLAPPTKRPTEGADDKPEKPHKGKGKDGKGGGKGRRVEIPEGCAAKDARGRPNCFGFNLGTCKAKVVKGRCPRGFHQCWRIGCNKDHPFSECTHGLQ